MADSLTKVAFESDQEGAEIQPDITEAGKESDDMAKKLTLPLKLVAVTLVIAGLAGVGSGFAVNKLTGGSTQSGLGPAVTPSSVEEIQVGSIYGSENKEVFSDPAKGVLAIGGINGEGSHHLIRPGGDSQTVYMTSSVLDLDMFAGYEVEVWGETFAAQKAGWLMDVGRVKVVGLESEVDGE